MTAENQLEARYQEFLRTRYFGSLDGLRCLSILAVIWHHTAGQAAGYFHRGSLGVQLFFAISGFLISTLLLREKEKYGRISLRNFYLRRTLRIFPVYYAVLGLYVALVFMIPPASAVDKQAKGAFFSNLPAFATYTSNWFIDLHQGSRVIFYFAWSLATEEQYYLVWPVIVASSRTWRGPVLAAFLLSCVAVFSGFLPATGLISPNGLPLRIATSIAPSICLGSLLAYCLHYRPSFFIAWRILGQAWSAPVLLALLVGAAMTPSAPALAIYVLMAGLVGACCIRPRHRLSPVLQLPAVSAIGVISYGMYLLHMLALNVTTRWISPSLPAVVTFLITVGITIVAATVSYRYYEQPFLRLKERFAASNSLPSSSAARAPDSGEASHFRWPDLEGGIDVRPAPERVPHPSGLT